VASNEQHGHRDCGTGSRATITEHEIARGQKAIERMLCELRQAHPEMRITADFEGIAPIRFVEVFYLGDWLPMRLDPLGLLERVIGHRIEAEIPPHILAAMAENWRLGRCDDESNSSLQDWKAEQLAPWVAKFYRLEMKGAHGAESRLTNLDEELLASKAAKSSRGTLSGWRRCYDTFRDARTHGTASR
jgi:hypothetical protein